MSVYKCKMCGGDLNVTGTDKVVTCEYCGTAQTVPSADDEKKTALFNRANRLRMNSEFDTAAALYEQLAAEFPEEAEAYWGLCLCNYGIEYVTDPGTGQKKPTCHRASFRKLTEDDNFKLAVEYADGIARRMYQREAQVIDRINTDILALSRNEKPYDVFICYKETDAAGERTPDSVLAQDIYDALTVKGYKVFFSRITLEDKLGQQYEPYIFAALNSAKIMLCVGTKNENFNAVWVKNEWGRFLRLAAKDKRKVLIPCYKDMGPYDLPDEFKGLQAQDLGKLGAIQDLTRGVAKLLGGDERPVSQPAQVPPRGTGYVSVSAPASSLGDSVNSLISQGLHVLETGDWRSAGNMVNTAGDIVRGVGQSLSVPASAPAAPTAAAFAGNVSSLLTRGKLALEASDWRSADMFFEQALNLDAENADAYLGKLMARQRVSQREALKKCAAPFDGDICFSNAMRFGDEALRAELSEAVRCIRDRNEYARRETIYNQAAQILQYARSEQNFAAAAAMFRQIPGHRDADALAAHCETSGRECVYQQAGAQLSAAKTAQDCVWAAQLFRRIPGYRNADELAETAARKGAALQQEQTAAAEKTKKRNRILLLAAAAAVVLAILIWIIASF